MLRSRFGVGKRGTAAVAPDEYVQNPLDVLAFFFVVRHHLVDTNSPMQPVEGLIGATELFLVEAHAASAS